MKRAKKVVNMKKLSPKQHEEEVTIFYAILKDYPQCDKSRFVTICKAREVFRKLKALQPDPGSNMIDIEESLLQMVRRFTGEPVAEIAAA
jgi:hypothetical protein